MNDPSPAAGLHELLADRLKAQPDAIAVALTDGRVALSCRQLQEAVEAFAASLLAAGIQPGDRVALVLPNSIEFVVAFLAITRIRAMAAPLNPEYRAGEFEFFLEDLGAVVLLDVPGEGANRQAGQAADTLGKPVWRVRREGANVELALPTAGPVGSPHPPTPVEPETDVALFLHTSGTTSRPKGVPLTHANLMASVRNIGQTYEFNGEDRSVLVMPLFHVHGLMAGLLAPLAAGAAVYIPESGRFSASHFWRDMAACQATWYTAVPTIHQILLARYETDYPRDDPPRLRFIRSCSSPLAPSVLNEMEAKFGAPVLEAYAMTEAAHQIASNPLPKQGPRKPGSVGQGRGVRIAILDPDLNELPPGREGEICIQGENVTRGYWNNPQATEEAFAGGWFHTGDQGCLDAEGYLTLTGRIKDIINRGGEKIAPSRVDEVLLSHPGVAEAVTFGAPDPKYGEEVNAAIVLKPGVTVTAEALRAHCLTELSAFAVPKRFFFVESLPRTGSGKVQRRKVAEYCLAPSSG